MRVFEGLYFRFDQGSFFSMDKKRTRRVEFLGLIHRLVNKKMAHA